MLACVLFSSYYHQVNVPGADGECLHSMRWVQYWNVGFLLVLLAHPELTPLLLSRCCSDTPNQQCRSDFILSKSNTLNVFILGFHRGTWIDWIPWFCWWCVLMAQEVWTYRMAWRCIPGSAVLLGCQYKVLKSVVQEPLAVRCQMRWVVYDNVVCLLPYVLWAFSVLTPILSSRCSADNPNKQCVSDFTASKLIILNVFTLCYHCGYFINWIPWFFWWRVLTAGSASSSQSCLYWARALLNSSSDTLYCIRVSTWGNSFGRNDNLPSLGRIFLLETVRNLWTGAQPYWYLPRMKWRPHQHPPNPFTWHLVWCW
jgi:hypothetical protein